MAFTSLNHYLDAEWLRYAYECTRKDGAVGVDGQTAQEYAAHLEQNLQSLMDRLKSGRYRAPPALRANVTWNICLGQFRVQVGHAHERIAEVFDGWIVGFLLRGRLGRSP